LVVRRKKLATPADSGPPGNNPWRIVPNNQTLILGGDPMKNLLIVFLIAFSAFIFPSKASAYYFAIYSSDYISAAHAELPYTGFKNDFGTLSAEVNLSENVMTGGNTYTNTATAHATITPANSLNQIKFTSAISASAEGLVGDKFASASTSVTYGFVVLADPGENGSLNGHYQFSGVNFDQSQGNELGQIHLQTFLNGYSLDIYNEHDFYLTVGEINILSFTMWIDPPLHTSSNPHHLYGEYTFSLAVPGNPAPLPSSLLLMGSTCMGLVGWQRFRKSIKRSLHRISIGKS
jgi:hypothetical protein